MAADMRSALPSAQETKRLRALLNIMKIFSDLQQDFPVSYIQAFLAVAAKPGQNGVDYAKDLEILQPTISRRIAEIGAKSRGKAYGKGGWKLVESRFGSEDLRSKFTYLTPKGARIIDAIHRELAALESSK